MKKTKKYYREVLNARLNIYDLKEAIMKYGTKAGRNIRQDRISPISNELNAQIIGYILHGSLFQFIISWQGDNTDGTSYLPYGHYKIPATYEVINDSSRQYQPNISFTEEQIQKAFYNIINTILK